MSDPDATFDPAVRRYIYDHAMRQGAPPESAATAQALASPVARVQAAYQRLAAAHVIVLQPDTTEILMAAPFSAVPTPFQVQRGDRIWYGNCIWDALGIPAMLHEDARIQTACGCCGTALPLTIRDGALVEAEGVIHFAIPAARWWDNIVFS